MRRSIPFVLTVLCSCSAARQMGSPGDFPTIPIPAEHRKTVVEGTELAYPDLENVGRDPFLTKLESEPPIVAPQSEPPTGGPKPPHAPPEKVEVRCPRSCEVTGIIEGPYSEFFCGGQHYAVNDAFGEQWIVSSITADRATVRLEGGEKTCALPFARAPAASIEAR